MERPPIIWEGEHIRFGTDEDTELCAGTLPYLDGVAGHLAEVLQRRETRVDYYWLPDGVEELCGEELRGCVGSTPEVFSTLTIHQHELVHALRAPQRLYLPLEEGLADAFGDDWTPEAPVSGDITKILEEHEHGQRIPWRSFPVVGHFVSYLRAAHGTEALLELDRASSYSDSFATTQAAFRDVYDAELLDEAERYEAEYPICDRRFYRDTAFDCSRNLVQAPNLPDEELRLSVSLSCDDPAVLGPRFDQRWTTLTLDVETPGTYFIYAGRADGDQRWPIRFQECNTSCFEISSTTNIDSQLVSGRLCLERSRYLFRFMDDMNFDDYEVIVRMVDPSCS